MPLEALLSRITLSREVQVCITKMTSVLCHTIVQLIHSIHQYLPAGMLGKRICNLNSTLWVERRENSTKDKWNLSSSYLSLNNISFHLHRCHLDNKLLSNSNNKHNINSRELHRIYLTKAVTLSTSLKDKALETGLLTSKRSKHLPLHQTWTLNNNNFQGAIALSQ